MNEKQSYENKLIKIFKKLKQSVGNQDWENSISICEQLISISLEKLLETEPEKIYPEKYTILGNFLLEKDKAGGALDAYNYANNLKTQLASYCEKLGKNYLEKQNLSLALKYFNKALENDSQSPELYGNLGTLYVQMQKYDQAIIYYQKAITLNPKLTAVYRNLSRLYNKINNNQEADNYWYQGFIAEYELITDSKSYELGNEFMKNYDIYKAILCYRRTLELNNNYKFNVSKLKQDYFQKEVSEDEVDFFQKLGLLFSGNKQYKQAIKSYEIAIEASKKIGNISDQLIIQFREAVESYSDASAQDYHYLGDLLRSKKNFDEAIDCLLKSIKISPDYRLSYVWLQYTKIDDSQRQKVINVYRDLLEQNPKNEMILGNLADMLTVNNNLKEAITYYQKSSYLQSIQKNPNLENLTWPNKKQKSPDFLIIGAPKAGTTSLYKHIASHPQVLLPHKKELDFFSRFYDYGADWYLAQFPSITDYDEYITGEATPYYLSFTEVPSRVYKLFPEVKLIVLLRNPVEQIISYHYHKLNHGIYQKNLEKAIHEELKPIDDLSEEQIMELLIPERFGLMVCLYYYHLKRWFQYFPRENFLIIKSEDFFNNPEKYVQQTYQFLGLAEYQLKEYRKVNVGHYPMISDEIKNYLADYCRPHNRKLEQFLVREFNWD